MLKNIYWLYRLQVQLYIRLLKVDLLNVVVLFVLCLSAAITRYTRSRRHQSVYTFKITSANVYKPWNWKSAVNSVRERRSWSQPILRGFVQNYARQHRMLCFLNSSTSLSLSVSASQHLRISESESLSQNLNVFASQHHRVSSFYYPNILKSLQKHNVQSHFKENIINVYSTTYARIWGQITESNISLKYCYVYFCGIRIDLVLLENSRWSFSAKWWCVCVKGPIDRWLTSSSVSVSGDVVRHPERRRHYDVIRSIYITLRFRIVHFVVLLVLLLFFCFLVFSASAFAFAYLSFVFFDWISKILPAKQISNYTMLFVLTTRSQ